MANEPDQGIEQAPEPNIVTASATARPVRVTTHTSDRELLGKLAAKVSACYVDIGRVGKNGVNKDQHYSFASVEDIYDVARAAMAANKLAILPNIDSFKEEYPAKGRKTTLYIPFCLIDCETGFSRDIEWMGECVEYSDKAISKCITASCKTLIRALFLIPAGIEDDPDSASPEVDRAPQRGKQAAQRGNPREEDRTPPPPEPVPAEPVEPETLTPGQLKNLLTKDNMKPFVAVCADKCLDPEVVVLAGWAEGARNKSELLFFATSQPSAKTPAPAVDPSVAPSEFAADIAAQAPAAVVASEDELKGLMDRLTARGYNIASDDAYEFVNSFLSEPVEVFSTLTGVEVRRLMEVITLPPTEPPAKGKKK